MASGPDPRTARGRLVRELCAGVMVDFLTGLVVGIRTVERERLDANVKGYCRALRALDIPACVLGDEGGFRDWFTALGRPQVVLGGLSLDNCTLLTALDMLADGFDVHVVVDVSGAESALVEQASMARLVQAGAVLHNWGSFACEAMGDWKGPFGAGIGKLVMAHSAYGALGVPQQQAT